MITAIIVLGLRYCSKCARFVEFQTRTGSMIIVKCRLTYRVEKMGQHDWVFDRREVAITLISSSRMVIAVNIAGGGDK